MKYPVLDDSTRDAMIIGYAENEKEAETIAEANLKEAGIDDEDLEALKQSGALTYNFRASHVGYQDFDHISDAELKNGFFDNA